MRGPETEVPGNRSHLVERGAGSRRLRARRCQRSSGNRSYQLSGDRRNAMASLPLAQRNWNSRNLSQWNRREGIPPHPSRARRKQGTGLRPQLVEAGGRGAGETRLTADLHRRRVKEALCCTHIAERHQRTTRAFFFFFEKEENYTNIYKILSISPGPAERPPPCCPQCASGTARGAGFWGTRATTPRGSRFRPGTGPSPQTAFP